MILFSVYGSPWMCEMISGMAKTLSRWGHQTAIVAWDEYAFKQLKDLGHENVIDMINMYSHHNYKEPEREQVRELLKFNWEPGYRPESMPDEYELHTIRRASQAWASCRFLLEIFSPKVLVIWNNLSFGGKLFSMLAKPDAVRYFVERGPFSGTMQFSTTGINADLRVAKEVINSSEGTIRVASDWVKAYKAKDQSAWPEIAEVHQQLPVELAKIQKPIILFAAQVAYDTQIVHHSSFGYNYPRVYDLLRSSWDSSSPYQLVIKLHPFAHIPHLHDKARQIPGAIVVTGGDIRDYLNLPNMHKVFTVNSSVGFESMLYGLPVATIGNNWYTSLTGVREDGLRDWMRVLNEKDKNCNPWPAAVYRLADGITVGEFIGNGAPGVDRIARVDGLRENINADVICKAIMGE
jgi:hypothetical protein